MTFDSDRLMDTLKALRQLKDIAPEVNTLVMNPKTYDNLREALVKYSGLDSGSELTHVCDMKIELDSFMLENQMQTRVTPQ